MQKATVEVMTSLVVHYALHNSENILTNYLNRKGVFKVELQYIQGMLQKPFVVAIC